MRGNRSNASLKFSELVLTSFCNGFPGAQELPMSQHGSHEDLQGMHPDHQHPQHDGGDYAEEENDLDAEMNPFEALQMQREAEFLGHLIEPLSQLPEEYAQYATNDLGDRLHQTVGVSLFPFLSVPCAVYGAFRPRKGYKRPCLFGIQRVCTAEGSFFSRPILSLTIALVTSMWFSSRQVEIFLADKEIHDLDGLDACLTDFLSLAELRADMESFRDEIVEYYMQDDVAQEGGEAGYAGKKKHRC
jgi:hypothetical protein